MARKEKFEFEADPEINNPFADLQIDNLPLGERIGAAAPLPLEPASAKKTRGRVVLRKETAHRGGKTVIVIHDFATFISTSSIEDLARKLRHACGCGGTTRQRTIEIQGNHVAKIRALLEQEGFHVAGIK